MEVDRDRGAPNIKAHMLSTHSQELRIVLVKKDGEDPANVTVTITGKGATFDCGGMGGRVWGLSAVVRVLEL